MHFLFYSLASIQLYRSCNLFPCIPWLRRFLSPASGRSTIYRHEHDWYTLHRIIQQNLSHYLVFDGHFTAAEAYVIVCEYLYLYSLIESARCESWNTLRIILRLRFIFGLSYVAYSPPTRNFWDTIYFLKFIRVMATASGFLPRIHQFHESNKFMRYEKKFHLWFVWRRKTSEVEFSLFRV